MERTARELLAAVQRQQECTAKLDAGRVDSDYNAVFKVGLVLLRANRRAARRRSGHRQAAAAVRRPVRG